MKATFLHLFLLLLIVLCGFFINCGDSNAPEAPEVDSPDNQPPPHCPLYDPESISGTLDPDFDIIHKGLSGSVLYVELLPDGKILVGGRSYPNDDSQAQGLRRFNEDGLMDADFNVGGSGIGPMGRAVECFRVLNNGQILVAGSFQTYNGISVPHHIIRVHADGTLDTSFNIGGTGTDERITALEIQPGGGILIGGRITTYNGIDTPDGVMRIQFNGYLDTNFNPGGSGVSIEDVPWTDVRTIAYQSGGGILVGGTFTTYNDHEVPNGIIRLTDQGDIDETFNSEGTGFDDDSVITHIVVDDTGSILVGGRFDTYNGLSIPNGIMRLNFDGTPDLTFNSGYGGIAPDDWVYIVYDFELLSNGRIAACGSFTTYNGCQVPNGLVLLDNNGQIDSSFNAIGAGSDYYLSNLAVQPDEKGNKIIVGGTFDSFNGIVIQYPLVQLLP